MAAPVDCFPDKQQGIPLEDPVQFFPLTRDNIRQNLPKVLRQLLSYDLQGLRKFESLTHAIYTRDAVFQYPLALLRGREAICQFWNGFLAGRALQRNDVHSVHIDMVWDPERLQAFVQDLSFTPVLQIEAWQHISYLAWVDRLINMPSWKVTTMQVLQFEEYPADGPGALRVTFQEELADQFVILGSIPMGLWTIRTDPGTPLNWVRNTVRSVTGRVMAVTTPVVVQLLEAVGWIKQ